VTPCSFFPPKVGGRPRTTVLLRRVCRNEEEAMKISARNMLKGKIVEVKKGTTTAHVRIDIGGQIVTAAITNESVEDLKLASGQTAYAVIKASDVMVGVD
jgi:molybdopterin-binding protein